MLYKRVCRNSDVSTLGEQINSFRENHFPAEALDDDILRLQQFVSSGQMIQSVSAATLFPLFIPEFISSALTQNVITPCPSARTSYKLLGLTDCL